MLKSVLSTQKATQTQDKVEIVDLWGIFLCLKYTHKIRRFKTWPFSYGFDTTLNYNFNNIQNSTLIALRSIGLRCNSVNACCSSYRPVREVDLVFDEFQTK